MTAVKRFFEQQFQNFPCSKSTVCHWMRWHEPPSSPFFWDACKYMYEMLAHTSICNNIGEDKTTVCRVVSTYRVVVWRFDRSSYTEYSIPREHRSHQVNLYIWGKIYAPGKLSSRCGVTHLLLMCSYNNPSVYIILRNTWRFFKKCTG